MKKKYLSAELELLKLEEIDLLTTSIQEGSFDENNEDQGVFGNLFP